MSVDPPDSDREQLLQQAIAFLQSPQVSDAPQERKVAFLQQKGLTPLEIETLLQQVTPQSTEQTPQSSIEQKQQTSQPSTEQKQQTSTRKGESTNTVTQSNYMTAIKYGLGGYSLLMTLMIGIYSLYLKYYRPWIKLLRETRQKRAQERQVFFSKVNLWAKQFSQEGLASEIQKMIESTTKDLKGLTSDCRSQESDCCLQTARLQRDTPKDTRSNI
ncbi:peroxisomal membrane anchor protein conserved region-domain-containing protein [Gorgonomyces haynaldii]|nr:peroxisomal membrane anchor protein conserved region-domain-containing protein [Gorgonomyces haynaldii]